MEGRGYRWRDEAVSLTARLEAAQAGVGAEAAARLCGEVAERVDDGIGFWFVSDGSRLGRAVRDWGARLGLPVGEFVHGYGEVAEPAGFCFATGQGYASFERDLFGVSVAAGAAWEDFEEFAGRELS